jgi:hypothetical protein
VHDSNGVYRFVIGVQFEVTNDKKLKKRLKRLDRLLRLLPTTLDVPERQDMRAEVVDEQKTEGKVANNMGARLEQALDGVKMKSIDAVNLAAKVIKVREQTSGMAVAPTELLQPGQCHNAAQQQELHNPTWQSKAVSTLQQIVTSESAGKCFERLLIS